ncbi:MAG TPA: hypothetical protein VGO52_13840 [Hyphomonadaceae bacterium]|jgi:hypothetical protein|nr:hypothetical protein [Hyphomonadaceae bacterium]
MFDLKTFSDWAAPIQALTGVVGVLGLILTLYYARLAWREARRSADEARRSADAANAAVAETRMIGRAQVRAYLALLEASCQPRPHPGQADFRISLAVRNVGQSPASIINASIIYSWIRAGAHQGKQNATARLLDIPAQSEERFEFSLPWRDEPLAELDALFVTVTLSSQDVFGDRGEATASFFKGWPGEKAGPEMVAMDRAGALTEVEAGGARG